MPFVYSTASCDTVFAVYSKTEPGQAGRIAKSVLIRGGANVAKGRAEFITKIGVRTEVSDEDMAVLLKIPNFQQMVDKGHMTIDDRRIDPEKVAKDMTAKDGSAPATPQDYINANGENEARPVSLADNGKRAESEDDDEE